MTSEEVEEFYVEFVKYKEDVENELELLRAELKELREECTQLRLAS